MGRPRRAIDPFKDPHGFLQQQLLPKSLLQADLILSQRVAKYHKHYSRVLSVKRAMIATVLNTIVALGDQALKERARGALEEILERIKKHEPEALAHVTVEQIASVANGKVSPPVS